MHRKRCEPEPVRPHKHTLYRCNFALRTSMSRVHSRFLYTYIQKKGESNNTAIATTSAFSVLFFVITTSLFIFLFFSIFFHSDLAACLVVLFFLSLSNYMFVFACVCVCVHMFLLPFHLTSFYHSYSFAHSSLTAFLHIKMYFKIAASR